MRPLFLTFTYRMPSVKLLLVNNFFMNHSEISCYVRFAPQTPPNLSCPLGDCLPSLQKTPLQKCFVLQMSQQDSEHHINPTNYPSTNPSIHLSILSFIHSSIQQSNHPSNPSFDLLAHLPSYLTIWLSTEYQDSEFIKMKERHSSCTQVR